MCYARASTDPSCAAKRLATLKLTPSSIVSSIVTLPKTTHPLDKFEKFVFDTWTMPGLLAPTAPGVEGETVIYAVVHGEYIERAFLFSVDLV